MGHRQETLAIKHTRARTHTLFTYPERQNEIHIHGSFGFILRGTKWLRPLRPRKVLGQFGVMLQKLTRRHKDTRTQGHKDNTGEEGQN